MMTPMQTINERGFYIEQQAMPQSLIDWAVSSIRAQADWAFAWPIAQATLLNDFLNGFLADAGIETYGPSDFVVLDRPVGDSMQWHDDSHGNVLKTGRRVFVCCYFTPTTDGRGALKIIPKSHLGGYAVFRSELERARVFLASLHYKVGRGGDEKRRRAAEAVPMAFSPHPKEVAVEVEAGSVVVCDENLIHAVEVNNGPGPRAMALQWRWLK